MAKIRLLFPCKQLQREVLECSGYTIGALLSLRQSERQCPFCISLALTVLGMGCNIWAKLGRDMGKLSNLKLFFFNGLKIRKGIL